VGAAHVAGLRMVVAADAVHGLAVVPITRSCTFIVDVELNSGCVACSVRSRSKQPPPRLAAPTCDDARPAAATDRYKATCGREPDGCAPAAAAPA